jgi:CDP-glucose 4,6-dehydratase
MESVVSSNDLAPSAWKGRSVMLTGHTGFKGSWLALWLHQLGAKVHGYALEPPTHPSLFEVADLQTVLASETRADLADFTTLSAVCERAEPEVVFHLAAQSLVREGYRVPLATFATNVMGTAHVLDAVRRTPSVRAVVVITTDKVYENHESARPYQEDDPLGGHDPYSGSKAAAEIVAASYRASFHGGPRGHPALIATARAGNVIGGGDWAADRLVPDCLRAFSDGRAVELRFPNAVRPWQHVLEPLSGYLQLAQRLLGSDGAHCAGAWNFGPDASGDATVGQVAGLVAGLWGGGAQVVHVPSIEHPHEAGLLHLDSSRARRQLDWRPRWSLAQAVEHTVSWHRAWLAGQSARSSTLSQIDDYMAARSPD